MSFEITTAFVQQYSGNVALLSQQKGSRLRACVREEPQVGKNAFYDQIGATTARKRTERHGDTPLISTPHSRRRVALVDYDWADLIDDLDKVKMLIDPQSSYAMNAAFAMGRAMDDAVIEAFTSTAYTGEEGGTSITFPSAQQIDISGTLTLAYLTQAKETLDAAEVDPETPRYFMLSANVLSDLLQIEKLTSADYATVKALVQGDIDTFMGFKFLRSERLPLDRTTTGGGSGDRSCFAWAQDGLLLAVGQNPIGKIDQRADKNYSTQVYYSMAIGATRMEEAKVVEVICQED